MALSSNPQPLPTASISKVPHYDGSLDLSRSQVFAALARSIGLDKQTILLLQSNLLQYFGVCLCLLAYHAFTLSVSSWLILSSVVTFCKIVYQLRGLRCLSSDQLKDADHVFTASQRGTKSKPPQNHDNKKETEVIVIDDSHDKNEVYASSSGRDLGNRGSDDVDRDESLHEAEDVLDHSNIDDGRDARTPVTRRTTDEYQSDFSGTTLGDSEPRVEFRHPEFPDECPQLKRKIDAPAPLSPPPLPDKYQHIAQGYKFEDGIGWVITTPEKRDTTAIRKKLIDPLSEYDKNSGSVYILKHKYYENLYKVGCAQSTEARRYGFRPCEEEMADIAYETLEVWGFRRVEKLAQLDMASRKVRMKACLSCFNKRLERMNDENSNRRKSRKDDDENLIKSHTEWFKGDFEDIKKCVEYWWEVVKARYVGGEFRDDSWEIARHGLSSQKRRLESAEESAQLREKFNNTPSRRPHSFDAAGRLDVDSPASEEDEEGEGSEGGCGEEETEGSPEMVEVRPVLWVRRDTRRDTSDDEPLGTTPPRGVLRPQARIDYGPGGSR